MQKRLGVTTTPRQNAAKCSTNDKTQKEKGGPKRRLLKAGCGGPELREGEDLCKT